MATLAEIVTEKRTALKAWFERAPDQYLPESGELKPWTISALEDALGADLRELGRRIAAARTPPPPWFRADGRCWRWGSSPGRPLFSAPGFLSSRGT
jgi:hypothetical protein